MEILEAQIRKQYQLFGHETFWSQLHAQDPKNNKLVSRELVQGISQVLEWAKAFNGKGNLYIGRAARDKAGIPVRTSVFTLDVDPRRVSGTASNPEEHGRAIQTGRQILRTIGDGYLCSSGNGALLIVPFDEPVEHDLLEFSEKAKQFEAQLRDVFQTPEVTIDATQDAARLARMLGTRNVKGDSSQWRVARIVSKPLHIRRTTCGIRTAIERISVPTFGTSGGSRLSLGTVGMETKLPQAAVGLPDGRSLPTYDHSVYPTREKAEFAFALRLKLAGLGPEDIRQQLAQYGYIQNPRDAQRVIEKLFANDGGRGPVVQRASVYGNGSGTGGALFVPPDPLWTPASGLTKAISGETRDDISIGTGFKFLDSKLGGFRPGYVYAVEAPTNVGKSTFITQVANHLARCGKRVLLVITEMDVREAVTRIRAIETGLSGHSLEAGRLSDREQTVLRDFQTRFGSYQLFIRYTTSPNQAAVEEDIKASKAEVVLWDYFQHFETGNESRQVQLGSLARWFESTALKYQIPFVVAAQLHRRVDFKTNKVLPSTMDQIKDCKVLNDAAKVVITLDWQHGEHGEEGPVPVIFDIQKNKGKMAKGVVRLNRVVPRFEDL